MSILNWKNKVLGYTAQMGGGGSSGGGQTTQQSNQYSGISPWAQPFVSSLLGAGQQQIFDTKSVQGTAAVPAQYVDAQGNAVSADMVRNSVTGFDSNGNPQTGVGSQYTLVPGTGTAGTPDSTQITGIHPYTAYGYNGAGMSAADQAAAQSAVAGFTPLQQQAYQGATNLQTPGQFGAATGAAGAATSNMFNLANTSNPQDFQQNVGGYMNPYIQQSLAPQLQLLAQQTGIQGAQQQSAATQVGAFGGSRSALANSLVQQQGNLAAQNAIAQGYNTAFNAAQNQYNQSGQFALNANQAALQGASTLGNLGTAQLGAQQGILGLQNQFGGQQQQQQQNIINAGMTNYQTAQQYPMTQLQQLSNLAAPYVTKDVTTTQQQAQPSTATQLAGLGTAGVAGLALANQASKAKGGIIKGYASGGITALNRKALLAPETMSAQTLDRSTKDGAIAPQVSGIAKAIQLSEQVNAKNASALGQKPPQGTIMDELQSKADQMDQAEMLPKAIAVLKHKMDQAIEEGNIPLAQKYAAELQQLTQLAQQQAPEQTPSAPAPEGIEQISPQMQQVADAGAPQQGIEAAPSNLPTQAMAEGGIVSFAKGGAATLLAQDDQYEDADAAEAAELKELYGSGLDNDFIQSIMPAAKQSGSAHPSAAISVSFEPKEGGIEALGSHKYASLVAKEAKRQGRDPEILLKMLQNETGGLKNPESARSKAGAMGIAQFMPATAKQYGINPDIPEEAAYGMVKHFGYLEDKYGDPKLAMAAYNWGEGNLNKWLKSGADPRKLPQETRKYASMAQGGIAHYDGTDGSLVTETKPTDIQSNDAQPEGLDSVRTELLQDIRNRRAESQKTREQNNLLALMQAGFGMAASKNIAPLGAIGEGGMQGIGALAQYRKQEGEESKDIAAQQLGLYKYGTTAENTKVLQEIKSAQNDLRKTPEERSRDEAEREYTRQVAAIDKRQAEHAKQSGGELDSYYQEQYDAQRNALRKQIYDHFKVPIQTEFKLPPIKTKPVEVKPTGYEKIMPPILGGMSKDDMDALQWANEHPDDPRADAIKKRLGK